MIQRKDPIVVEIMIKYGGLVIADSTKFTPRGDDGYTPDAAPPAVRDGMSEMGRRLANMLSARFPQVVKEKGLK